ncbi:MAG TPA: DUF4440 domain-containing protein [Phycisphaerales bacterium]|nr:DUF4440 domain-containing protein [Phycisphaerales bacterium]
MPNSRPLSRLLPPVLACTPLLLAAPALAQARLDAEAPTPLNPPNPLIHYTLENPWPLAILLIVVALILYFSLSARDPKKARRLAPIPLLLAIACIGAGYAITTAREQVRNLTKALVTSVATGDGPAVDRALTPSARLFSPATPAGMDKDQIINRVQTMLGPNGVVRVDDLAVLEAQVDASSKDRALVQVKVRVTAQGTPVISWWRLDAVPAGNTWQFSGIKFISANWNIPGV